MSRVEAIGSKPSAYRGNYTLREGKIVRREIFRDHAEALEAVGLSE